MTPLPRHLTSGHFGGLSFFPNPEWEKWEDGIQPVCGSCCPGFRGYTERGLLREGLRAAARSSQPSQEQGEGGGDPSPLGLEMSKVLPSVTLAGSASPHEVQAVKQSPSRPQGPSPCPSSTPDQRRGMMPTVGADEGGGGSKGRDVCGGDAWPPRQGAGWGELAWASLALVQVLQPAELLQELGPGIVVILSGA